MTPTVSFVIPYFNVRYFVGAAIDSVLEQSYRDFEVICVDDGSTDGSRAIVEERASGDRRIVTMAFDQNRGIAEAMNAGCRQARGEFVARMDADDVSLPTRLARQVAFLQSHPDVGVVGTAMETMTTEGLPRAVYHVPESPGLVAWSLMFACCVANGTVLFRRAVFDGLGWYPVGYAAEDYALFIRALATTRVANLPDVLYRYRIWPSSYSRTRWNTLEGDSARILLEMMPGLAESGVTAEDVRAARALGQHDYPRSAAAIHRLGDVLQSLHASVSRLAPLTRSDLTDVKLDAGVRLWLLSALALRAGAPGLSARLGMRALRAHPAAAVEFSQKSMRRLVDRFVGSRHRT